MEERGRHEPRPHQAADPADPLQDRLGSLFEGATPPAELRGQLRAEAARRFGPARRWRVLRTRVLPVAAAAAAALLAMVALRGDALQAPEESVTLAEAAEELPFDLDASGTVDVYDAYLYARAIREGKSDGLPDIDGDGLATRADADSLAATCVEVIR